MKPAIRTLAPLLFAAFQAFPAAAQSEESDSIPAYSLEGVTVTTTRAAVDRDRVSQRIDLVQPLDLERTGARTAAEAIRGSVPVDVIEYPGLLTGVSIRGFRPQFSGTSPRTLILVDGRPAGTNNLAIFHTGALERVEVLRGPASALYGPNAMGGVVNLVRGRSTGLMSGRAAAGFGSFGAYDGYLSAGGHLTGPVDFDLSVATSGQSNGYRTGSGRFAGRDSLLKTLPDGEEVRLPWSATDKALDFTRFTSRGVNARIGLGQLGPWRLDLSAEDYAADNVESPGDLNVTAWDSRSLKDVSRRGLDLALSGEYRGQAPLARLYAADERVDYYNSPADTARFVNFRQPIRTYGVQVQNEARLGFASIVAGSDYAISDARSERFVESGVKGAPFSPDSRTTTAAAFVQGGADLFADRLGLSAGLRYDRIAFAIRETPHLAGFPANTERRGVLTPTAGLRLQLAPGARLYANVGEGFVNPDAFHVAGYSEARADNDRSAVFVTRGNPQIQPETSLNRDIGVALVRPGSGLEIDLAYFHTDVRDRIVSTLTPETGVRLTSGGDTILATTSYSNVDEAKIRGVETRLSLDLGRVLEQHFSLRLFLNGTAILRAEERSVETDMDRRIQNVASRTVVAGIDYDAGRRLAWRLAGRYVGERSDADYVAWWEPGEILYPSYLVVDLHTTARLGDRFDFRIDLRNLADEDYFEVRGYNLPGRSIRMGVSARF